MVRSKIEIFILLSPPVLVHITSVRLSLDDNLDLYLIIHISESIIGMSLKCDFPYFMTRAILYFTTHLQLSKVLLP